ncbi:MAG: rhodanese-like domain-containing protein [Actinomycetota bacterium]
MHRLSLRSLLAALIVLLMVLAACAEDDADDAAEEEDGDEDLALDLDDEPDEDAAEEDEDGEADDEEAEDDEAAEEDFDVVAAVDEYASTLPDGWGFETDIDAFKDAAEVEGTVIIDVRSDEEVAETGVIPGAAHIPIRELAANLNVIPTDQPVWVYCASGWRAGMAHASLGLIGYDNVRPFMPGSNGWEAAGEEFTDEQAELEDVGDPDFQPEMIDAVDGFLSTMPEGYLTNSLDEVKEARDAGATIIDVRQPEEYEDGRIEDAVSIPLREVAASVDEVPEDTDVIVMCQVGGRASMGLTMLRVMGYDNAEGFPGSFEAWVEAGEAVVE